MTNTLRDRVLTAVAATGVVFEAMDCDPDLADTATFCAHYDIPLDHSANAIMLASKRPAGLYAVFLVLATTRLDVNGMGRKLMDVKKVSFAPSDVTARETGMVIGGVTPFGLPQDLHVYVDGAIVERSWVIVGGGTRDLKLKIDPTVFTYMENVTVVADLARPAESL
ncbi:MAG: hypothetical protein M3132_11320 [Actinomycetia bacterium]|nr:hypothetical protein [Actinomycetes bacterium]